MAVTSLIVKFVDDDALESFRQKIQSEPEYHDLRIHFFTNPPDAIIKSVDTGLVPRLREAAGSKARVIDDYRHDLF